MQRLIFCFSYDILWAVIGNKPLRIFSEKECDGMEKRRREDALLLAPNTEGNVWPKQACPAFEPRADTPEGLRQCWYCRHADFHLDKPRALEVGVCYWPKKISK